MLTKSGVDFSFNEQTKFALLKDCSDKHRHAKEAMLSAPCKLRESTRNMLLNL